jgi:hypothetical protein
MRGFIASGFGPAAFSMGQTQTLASSLGSTLDLDTGWAKTTNVFWVGLYGRVFGQSVGF